MITMFCIEFCEFSLSFAYISFGEKELYDRDIYIYIIFFSIEFIQNRIEEVIFIFV